MAGMPNRDLVQIVTVASDGISYPRRYGTPMLYLIRPDGYLTARGTPARFGSIHDYLDALAPDASTARPGYQVANSRARAAAAGGPTPAR